MTHRVGIAAASLLVLAAAGAFAQDCPTTFGSATPTDDEQFGWSVAIDDGIALIGNRPGNATRAGSASLVDVATGTQIRKFVEPGEPTDTLFGLTVALTEKYALVAAQSPSSHGAVYVFDAKTGAPLHRLTASDGHDFDLFGVAIAAKGDLAAIGASRHLAGSAAVGKVYAFNLVTGSETFSVSPNSPRAVGDLFGEAVAVDGNTLVVGAWNDDSRALNTFAGAVHVFDLKTRKLKRTLFSPNPATHDEFGKSVAIEGSLLLVGAPGEASSKGAVYMIDAATGAQRRRIVLAEGQGSDRFGGAVAVRGRFAVASALLLVRREGAGAAYVFDASSGERLSTVPPGGRSPSDFFGNSIALDDVRLICGAPLDDDRGGASGEIGVFVLDDLPDTPIVFDPLPELTTISVDLTIPGRGTFHFEFTVRGRIVAKAPLDCKPPKSFEVVEAELRPVDPIAPFQAAPGLEFTFHEPGITIAGDGTPAAIAPDGTFTQPVQFSGVGTLEFDFLGAKGAIDLTKAGTIPFTISGKLGDDGSGLRLDALLPATTNVIDLGLGALNPSYTVTGTFAASRSARRFVQRTPSVARKAKLGLDFVDEASDSVTFSGTFERTLPPDLTGGATGVLRIGAFRADVALSDKGTTAKGAPAAVKLKVKKKGASFKVTVKLADLRTPLAALPVEASLPRAVPWSLVLDDEWNLGGELSLNGGDKLTFSSPGVIARATLSLTK